MKLNIIPYLIIVFSGILFQSCIHKSNRKDKIIEMVGMKEYTRIMNMSAIDFDQSEDGFRKHWRNYDLIRLIIPEFIEVNQVPEDETKLMHWHLGQMHASNDHTAEAIAEMKLSYNGNNITWDSYVKGTIAFLEKDKPALLESITALRNQENKMNIQILEHMLDHFEMSYKDASQSQR